MRNIWKVDYQLVPLNLHFRNAAERAICTFKAHFLSILAGIGEDFPKNMWDLMIPQTEMTLNFLQQPTLKPETSAWANFNGPIIYKHAPSASGPSDAKSSCTKKLTLVLPGISAVNMDGS